MGLFDIKELLEPFVREAREADRRRSVEYQHLRCLLMFIRRTQLVHIGQTVEAAEEQMKLESESALEVIGQRQQREGSRG